MKRNFQCAQNTDMKPLAYHFSPPELPLQNPCDESLVSLTVNQSLWWSVFVMFIISSMAVVIRTELQGSS